MPDFCSKSVTHVAVLVGATCAGAAAWSTSQAKRKQYQIQCQSMRSSNPLLVIGSLNADIVLEINRFPKVGETLNTRTPDTGVMVPGGKGANQAVAAARLSQGTPRQTQFVCQFGNDANAQKLQRVLEDNCVDLSGCAHCKDKPSGQAFIFLQPDGSNSILIVGGSNLAWPSNTDGFKGLIESAGAVLLQREIPEVINEMVAHHAHSAGVPVMQDVGGEERPFSSTLLQRLEYICPNETELNRLTGMPTTSEEEVVSAACSLQQQGVKNIVVTLGGDGAILITNSGEIVRQKAFAIPGGKVVDTTGAGDCFRAALAVALVDGMQLAEGLRFAAAAGALACSRMGAIPSLPTRSEVLELLEDK